MPLSRSSSIRAIEVAPHARSPDTAHAMQASAALAKRLGIEFTTARAVAIEEFDKLMG